MIYTFMNEGLIFYFHVHTKVELDQKYTKVSTFLVTSVIDNATTNFSSIFAKKSKSKLLSKQTQIVCLG